jgi:outer membrane lipoprotein SlyB
MDNNQSYSSNKLADIAKSINNGTYASNYGVRFSRSSKGAVAGLVVGLAYALIRGKSKLTSCVLGATIGGLIGYLLPSKGNDATVKSNVLSTREKDKDGEYL